MWMYCIYGFILLHLAGGLSGDPSKKEEQLSCSRLSRFQYLCKPPVIDPETQQPTSCQPDNSITVLCTVIPGINCDGLLNDTQSFELRMPESCDYNAHASFSTALMLSIFLGFLGADRLYLGYYAVGLFKMLTFGGLFILWLTDVVLISLQILLPADGTKFVMPYYGPQIVHRSLAIFTYFERVSTDLIKLNMATQQQLEMVAELEVEMMSDMYRRMTNACQEKCIAKTFRESELTKGEAVCLDRCVAKYLDVHEKLGKRLTTMSQSDEATLQKLSQQ